MIAPSGLRDDMVVITDADTNNPTIVDQQFPGDGKNDSNEYRVAFVYPEGGGNSSIQVQERDVRHLNPYQSSPKDKYLTDTAIDFIAKHLVNTTPNQSKGCLPFVSSVLFHTHLRSLLDICNKDSTQQFSMTCTGNCWYPLKGTNNWCLVVINYFYYLLHLQDLPMDRIRTWSQLSVSQPSSKLR